MKARALVGAALALLTSCGNPQRPVEGRQQEVVVDRSGSEQDGKRIGAAALLRVRGQRNVGPITLELSFLDRDGNVVDRTDESLPYCAAQSRCWWAASFWTTGLGHSKEKDLSTVERVDVEVKAAPPYDGNLRAGDFEVSREPDGSIRGTVPVDEGIAYVIAFANNRPRRGESVSVTPDGGRRITITPDVLPRREGETLRAFFYQLTVQPGH